MNAPLPEVPCPAPDRPIYPRRPPRALTAVVLSQVALLGWMFEAVVSQNGSDPRLQGDALLWGAKFYGQTLGLLLFALPFYFLWRGWGWARRLVLWMIMLFFVGRCFDTGSGFGGIQEWREGNWLPLLSLFADVLLLIYLNLPVVKAHFARRREPVEKVE